MELVPNKISHGSNFNPTKWEKKENNITKICIKQKKCANNMVTLLRNEVERSSTLLLSIKFNFIANFLTKICLFCCFRKGMARSFLLPLVVVAKKLKMWWISK